MKIRLNDFLEEFVCQEENLHVIGLYPSAGSAESELNYHLKITAEDILSPAFKDGLFLLNCPVMMVSADVIQGELFMCQTVLCIVVVLPDGWVPAGC